MLFITNFIYTSNKPGENIVASHRWAIGRLRANEGRRSKDAGRAMGNGASTYMTRLGRVQWIGLVECG